VKTIRVVVMARCSVRSSRINFTVQRQTDDWWTVGKSGRSTYRQLPVTDSTNRSTNPIGHARRRPDYRRVR